MATAIDAHLSDVRVAEQKSRLRWFRTCRLRPANAAGMPIADAREYLAE